MDISTQPKERPSLWAVHDVPDPEVSERPKRRKYTAEYKLKVLKEADLTKAGDVGALLRREGIYSSTLQTWRRQRERGEFAGLSPKKRGPKSLKESPLTKKVRELETENRQLQRRLKHAELILDIQKKISEITGIPLKPIEFEEED